MLKYRAKSPIQIVIKSARWHRQGIGF